MVVSLFHLQISEVDSEIQASEVTDGNIISICAVNVPICIHLKYCKAKTFTVVGDFADSAPDKCWLICWSAPVRVDNHNEAKVYQQKPRKITGSLDGTISEFYNS